MDLSLAKVKQTAVGLEACWDCIRTRTVIKTVYSGHLYDISIESINQLTSISETGFAWQVLLLKANGCTLLRCERIASWIPHVYMCTRTAGKDGSWCCAVLFFPCGFSWWQEIKLQVNMHSSQSERKCENKRYVLYCNDYFVLQKRIVGRRAYVGETVKLCNHKVSWVNKTVRSEGGCYRMGFCPSFSCCHGDQLSKTSLFLLK